MRVSVYNKRTGEIVRIVTASTLAAVLENVGPDEEISEDDTPAGLDDLSMKVDPKTGLHRAKTEAELTKDKQARDAVRDAMWQKETANRAAHRQSIIDSGVSPEIADAIMAGVYGREQRE